MANTKAEFIAELIERDKKKVPEVKKEEKPKKVKK